KELEKSLEITVFFSGEACYRKKAHHEPSPYEGTLLESLSRPLPCRSEPGRHPARPFSEGALPPALARGPETLDRGRHHHDRTETESSSDGRKAEGVVAASFRGHGSRPLGKEARARSEFRL